MLLVAMGLYNSWMHPHRPSELSSTATVYRTN